MTHGFDLVERLSGVTEWRRADNGLTVLTCPTPVAPVVGFGVVYRVGSRNEVAGHTGATHILEHLMFKGTRRFNRDRGNEIARVLHRVGAAFNATTWLDRTNYYEVLPADQLALAVDIEADRMRGALVRDEDLASERTVVLNELEMGESEPFELLLKGSFAHAFLEHPYHHPTIGWRGDVEHVTAEVLRGFYDTYYHPDNATVMVVGDVDETVALAEVERGFGQLPAGPGPIPEVTIREGGQRGERRFTVHRAGELGCLAMTWHIPEALHPDLPPLEVLTQVLSDGVTSRLYQRLVETNLCLGVNATALGLHDPGVFQILASLAPGIDHRQVEDIIRDEVALIGEQPPLAAELARAKVQTKTDLAFHHESPGRIMAGLTEAVAVGDWRCFVRELERVSAVTEEDLQRVAAASLTDRGLTVGWFVPENGDGASSPPRPAGPKPCFFRRPFAERVSIHPLPGGARLAVLANPHAPTVTIAGSLRAGVGCVRDGRFAVPSLTAAMLDRGTSRFDRLALAGELEDHGLQVGVRASGSAPMIVSFSGQGLAEELPRLAGMMAEVLRRPTFPTQEFDILRTRILGALVREREETHALAHAALTRRLYPQGHPRYRRPVAVREQELESLTCEDLAAFHSAAYSPEGLVLAVVGDVEPERVATLIEELLGEWVVPRLELPEWTLEGYNEPGEERIPIADRPNLDVFLGHRSHLRRGDPDEPAAVLANSCLGQSTLTSRLGMAVRDRAGYSYGVYSRFFGTIQIPGPWAVYLSVSAENLSPAAELCRSVIAEYVEDGPSEEELADERLAQAGAYRVGLAANVGVARELVTVLTTGESLERLDAYPDRLLNTDRDEVVEAIKKHIHPDRLVMTAAGTLT